MTPTWRLLHEKIQVWYEAWNTRDWNLLAGLLSDKLIVHDVALGRSIHGKSDYLKYARDWAEAFPDGKIKITRIVSAGPHGPNGYLAYVEYTGSGTQSGYWGVFPPAHRKTTFKFCDLLRFENDRLVSCTTYGDLYRPLTELGHVASARPSGEGQAA